MRLKSLELQGFKSFPDKTVLSFGDGITAIVGPNGSGKSNISDGVRWVLGEQSTRTLRGSKMEDVIFGGTQKRGPVGFAEVSLTIDNSDGILPTDYNEVTITRRFYRSGESEFYINRTAVRLRDIHELLMDTGLGRDGYSIIGQGRIDEILSLKSEDRREIFEEASGISKFRHHKEESERKLLATEENLIRIRDIISELETQVGPLAKQAEEAKRYLKIFEELRTLEVNVWLLNLDKVRENAAKFHNDYQIANSQFERGQALLEELYNELEELSSAMREKDVALECVRGDLHEAERQKHEVENEISLLKASIENNLHNIKRIKSELSEETDRAGGINSQITDRAARIEGINSSEIKINSEIDRQSQNILSAAQDSDDLGTRLDELREKEQLAEASAAELRISLSAAATYLENFDAREKDIAAELEKRNNELKEAKEKNTSIRESFDQAEDTCNSIGNSLAGYELKSGKREERLNIARDTLQKVGIELDSMRHKLKILTDMERDFQGYSQSVKSVMRAYERGALGGIRGTVSQLMRVEDKFTVAIETILGGALQNIVVDNETAAKEAITYLKNTDGGRATFLPLTSVHGNEMPRQDLDGKPGFIDIASRLVGFDEKYRGIFQNLLGRTAVAENLNQATEIAKSCGYRFRIVTLDGQIINAGGSFTGGSVSKNAGILSRANEIKRLEEHINTQSGKLGELEREKNEAEREYNAIRYEIEVFQTERRKAEDILLRAQTELGHYKILLSGLNEQIDTLEEERLALSGKRSEQLRMQSDYESKLSENEKAAEELRGQIAELIRDHSELIEKKSEISEQLSKLRMELAEIRAERSETEKTLNELSALQSAMEGDRRQKEQLIDDYLNKNHEIESEINNKQVKVIEFLTRIKEISENETKIGQEKLSLEAQRNKKDKESKDKNDEILRLERERSRLESKKESFELEEKQLVDKLWETYELTLASAQQYVINIDSISAAGKRISELKAERKSLGTVNVGAIEEYDRVSERYQFMSEQRDDLEKAKSELTAMIEEITAEMKAIFASRFEVINTNFGETFAEIFGGGKAELSLADPSDILNCGIEIKVQPPGKTLKTITLLSGGERAFVAIALYFAIMKVRPTPFCVLDEIEAALDDVNVARFASYLRKLTATTQFIVITHRRGTMEEADVLYGVTMQEQGISKMLTISMAEVEKELKIKLT